MKKLNRAIFLDRDGTLIRDAHYLNSIAGVRLYKGVAGALATLKKRGFKLIVISNQSGISRGIVSKTMVEMINRYLSGLLWKASRVRFDAVYYCPHAPQDNCLCRKPKPDLIQRACRRFNIDLTASYVVGDKICDMDLARAIGVKPLLVLTGHGRGEYKKLKNRQITKFGNFREATRWILKNE